MTWSNPYSYIYTDSIREMQLEYLGGGYELCDWDVPNFGFDCDKSNSKTSFLVYNMSSGSGLDPTICILLLLVDVCNEQTISEFFGGLIVYTIGDPKLTTPKPVTGYI